MKNRFTLGIIVGLISGLILTTTSLAIAEIPLRLKINGQFYNESRPIMIENTIYVPVRFVAEHLGAIVKWDNNTNTVEIEQKTLSQISSPQISSNTIISGGGGGKISSHITSTKNNTPSTKTYTPSITSNTNTTNTSSVENQNIKLRQSILNKISEIRKQGAVGYWSSESAYRLDLTELQNERQKYQDQLNSLSMDDSLDAKFIKTELEQKISKLNDKISIMKDKRSRQLQIENLEKQLDNL